MDRLEEANLPIHSEISTETLSPLSVEPVVRSFDFSDQPDVRLVVDGEGNARLEEVPVPRLSETERDIRRVILKELSEGVLPLDIAHGLKIKFSNDAATKRCIDSAVHDAAMVFRTGGDAFPLYDKTFAAWNKIAENRRASKRP